MRRIVALSALLAVIAAACAPAASGGGAGDFSITQSEFKFTPASIELPAGVPLHLKLKNAGTVEHDFAIEKAGVKVLVKPGATATRNIQELEPGVYEILCTVPGHKEAGMVGTLTVK